MFPVGPALQADSLPLEPQVERIHLQMQETQETWVQSLGWEIPGGGHGNSPRYLRGKFHGHRSLAGYSPWGHEESDTNEQLNTHTEDRSTTHF